MRRLALLIVVLAALLCGCGSEPGEATPGGRLPRHTRAGRRPRLPARVSGEYLELSTAKHGFQPRFWPGVNLGSTVPGR